MVEIRTQLEELEVLVDTRVNAKVIDNIKIKKAEHELYNVKVDKAKMLKRLQAVKVSIKKRHDDGLKLWEKAVEVYSEMMKKQLGSKQLKFPEKPKMPSTYETINGYIDLFETLTDKEIYLDMKFLEQIFVTTKLSINAQRDGMYNLACYTSGSALGISDYAMTMSR